MQFKVKNTNITISFTFFALILMLIILKKTDYLYTSIFSALLHEIGHLCALKHFGADILEFKISLFGGNIKTQNIERIDYLKDIIISLSGPMVNLYLSLIFCFFNKFFENSIFIEIIMVNLILAVFNLLPFYSFDGGKILEAILKIYFNETIASRVITIISFIVLIPITYFSILMFLSSNNNFYFILVSLLMLLTIILKK